ncbi:MAG: contractile injection system tape measure protein, partial [Bacteroidota bacterium]
PSPILFRRKDDEIARFPLQNAGLALLWPFLPNYFHRLQLLEDDQFRNQDSARRAVLLLQYIITGEPQAPEHQLLFNKLLCGLPPNTPLPNEIEIQTHEIHETQALLEAILQNWPPLRNSSIQELRSTFLQRDAILVQRQDNWDLHVQPGPFDMLLEKIPWSYQIIMLKWLKLAIYVTWPIN